MDQIIKNEDLQELPKKNIKPCKMEKIIKRENFKISGEPHQFGRAVMKGADQQAIVNVRKNGDVIEAIEVLCPCGNKIEILCQYE